MISKRPICMNFRISACFTLLFNSLLCGGANPFSWHSDQIYHITIWNNTKLLWLYVNFYLFTISGWSNCIMDSKTQIISWITGFFIDWTEVRSVKMNATSEENNLTMYLKVIDYKRSIGITQWTILSIFLTVSEAILVFGLSQKDRWSSNSLILFGVFVYWLGFFLYNRYRKLNRQVAKYLVKLEKDNPYDFQKHLNVKFHRIGYSTKNILIIGGLVYIIIVIFMIYIRWSLLSWISRILFQRNM